MTDNLTTLLNHIGYAEREPQRKLYDAMLEVTPARGLVAQAGTGTGKSIAVLAAAASAVARTGKQSLIVTPTRVLMDQYMAKDVPAAAEAFNLDFAELRGRAHYHCEKSEKRAQILDTEYETGCWGEDVRCTEAAMYEEGYDCDYQLAKMAARDADVVVTNTDFWLINDRLLAPIDAHIFDPEGALFVDEAHQLDAKMREYASRSMSAKRLSHYQFASAAGKELAGWIEKQAEGRLLKESPNFPVRALLAIAEATLPDGAGKAATETHEAAKAIVARIRKPNEACVLHVSEGAIRMDWTTVAASAGEVLGRRPFSLVSATIPRSMPRTLGVPESRYVNVGHPFDYSKSTLQISKAPGDFKSRGKENFATRSGDILDAIEKTRGGSLVIVNSRNDCEFLGDYLDRKLATYGIEVRAQTDERWTNEQLTEWFKTPGGRRKVLVGMESFKTGFDAPGDLLTTVVLWALPYKPAGNPVWKQIADMDFNRYNDEMKVSAVQAIGRLVRDVSDSGHVLIADARGQRLLDQSDPLTSHLKEFRQVERVTAF